MAKFVLAGKEYANINEFAAAAAELEATNARLAAELAARPAEVSSGPVRVSVKNGKLAVFFTDSSLAYQGRAFEHFGAPMEALIAAWPEIEAAYLNNKAKLVRTWQAYGDIPVGGNLPDGSSKPAPKAK